MTRSLTTSGQQHKLLIVCPHFAPVNGADGQRARIYLEGFFAAGWTPEILACNPADLPMVQSPLMAENLPPGLVVHRVPCRPQGLGRLVGASTTSRNALPFMREAGAALLRDGGYRGVFFSTTAFRLLPLGLEWAKSYGVPFVVDLQDPWYQDYYARHPEQIPPGGRLRFALANRHARRWEKRTLEAAGGVVVVSPAYEANLRQRYQGLTETPFLVLPFGAAKADFDLLKRGNVSQNQFDPDDGLIHLVHVGRGGEDLWPTLRPLFGLLANGQATGQPWAQNLRLHFIGTSYAPEGRRQLTIVPLAQQMGIANLVFEQPARIDYFEALRCLVDSSGIVLPFSSDPDYNASKIHNCVLSGRPILALTQADSVAAGQLKNLARQLTVVHSDTADTEAALASWLQALGDAATIPPPADYPWEATRLAHKLAAFLDPLMPG